jgi:hypothetical protein
MTTKKKIEESKEIESEIKFTKVQMLSSEKYADHKDLISILLEADQTYSFSEVDTLINNFMEGKVK